MTSLTLVRRIKARPSIVFEALTTPEGIASWWGPDGGPVLVAETEPQVGGRFRVRFRMLDGSEHESSGEYLEVVKPERLRMSWRWTGGVEDPGESLVETTLRAVAEGKAANEINSRGEIRNRLDVLWEDKADPFDRDLLNFEDAFAYLKDDLPRVACNEADANRIEAYEKYNRNC
jgi:uncharacterized protein YndB with AHSA1/START domain